MVPYQEMEDDQLVEMGECGEIGYSKPISSLKQWGNVESRWFPLADYQLSDRLPAGVYDIRYESGTGFYVQQRSIQTDELFHLPIPAFSEILEDINKFWQLESSFERYNFLYKRGILLYGLPGNGKSTLIQLLIQHLIEQEDGIVFNVTDVELYSEFISDFYRAIEPNRPIIAIMEDIDEMLDGRTNISHVLNLLDGIKQIRKVVYIATTNYPEKLQERISNRPSRFDRRYHIGLHDAEVRRAFILKKLKPQDLEQIDLEEWVTKTEGLTLAHLKEVIVSAILFKKPLNEVLEGLNEMNRHKPHSSEDRTSSGVGFKG